MTVENDSPAPKKSGAPKSARGPDGTRIPDPDKPGSFVRADDPRVPTLYAALEALASTEPDARPDKPAPVAGKEPESPGMGPKVAATPEAPKPRAKRPPRVDATPPVKPLSEPIAPDPIAEGRRRIAANAPYWEGVFAQTTTPLVHMAAAVYAGIDLDAQRMSYGLTRFKPDGSGTVEVHPLEKVQATAVISRSQGEIAAYYAEGFVPDHPLMNAGLGLGSVAAMIALSAAMKYGFIPRPPAEDRRNPPDDPTPTQPPVAAVATVVS